jgi:hypothetical protein
MKAILTAALVLAVSTSTALADGAVKLTDTQLDQITAGVSVRSGGLRAMYFTPRTATFRVATPGVNVAFVPLNLDDLQNRFGSR